jgi:hypothetical protein
MVSFLSVLTEHCILLLLLDEGCTDCFPLPRMYSHLWSGRSAQKLAYRLTTFSQMAVLFILLSGGSCFLTFCVKCDTDALLSPLRHHKYDALCTRYWLFVRCIRLNGCSVVSLTADKQVHVQTCSESPITVRKLCLDTFSSGLVIPIILLYCCRIKWRHQYP